MNLKRICLFLFFTILAQFSAKANFDFNNNCITAYQAILQLKLSEAKILITKEKQQNPTNGITVLLDNYVDFFTVLTTESKDDYERFKKNKSSRINLLEKQDENSPYYLFAQAEIDLQWALLKGKFQDYFSAAIEINRANDLLRENARKYPWFSPNKKSLALINVILGSVPASIRGTLRTFGLGGNSIEGIKDLEYLINAFPKTNFSFYQDETIFYYAFAEAEVMHSKINYTKILKYIALMDNNSLLKSYVKAYVSLKSAKTENAINAIENKPKGQNYAAFASIYYILGNAKLNKMDSDATLTLLKFIKDNRGLNLIKDAYLKVAYTYLLKGDFARYQTYLKLVITQGNTFIEKDKQALKEATDIKPNLDLLKARLQFDGGYYSQALQYLKDKKVDSFKLLRDKIEYYYRLGRIYDEINNDTAALVNYQQAINLGKNTSYYFAANAALNAGMVCERNKEDTKAKNFYNQAIAMKHHEYENSIENKAKEALKKYN